MQRKIRISSSVEAKVRALRILLSTSFLFFITLPLSAQVDSTYVDYLRQDFLVRAYISERFMHLVEDAKNNQVSFRSNTPYSLGMGIAWRGISLSVGYGFDFLRNPAKGTTEAIDFRGHYYRRKVLFDLFIQSYTGFFSENKRDNERLLFPNLSVSQFGFSTQYIFNNRRFSSRAAFLQTEHQLKSAGTFMLGGGIYFNIVTPDSLLVVHNNTSLSNFQSGLSGGYAYIWVVHKNFFVTAALTAGLNLGGDLEGNGVVIYPSFFPRLSAAYNAETWSVGFSAVNNSLYISFAQHNRVRVDAGSLLLTFIKRIDNTPKVVKTVDDRVIKKILFEKE